VQLVAVTKTFSFEALSMAYAHGCRDFGENYVQELISKRILAIDAMPDCRFHMIGGLQRNKVKTLLTTRAGEPTTVVQTVDSEKLASEIAKHSQRQPQPIWLQVNIDQEPQKSGCLPEHVLACPRQLTLQGLMTIPKAQADAEFTRPRFAALRQLRDSANARFGLDLGLSMGMSDDFEIAIEEGASVVRVGSRLFGQRG
jgi:pyridoxal phosphate enzyme (YggS family)